MKCDIEMKLFDPDIYISKMHTHRLTDVHRFRHDHQRRITYDHHTEYVQFLELDLCFWLELQLHLLAILAGW